MDENTKKFLLINKLCFAEQREVHAQLRMLGRYSARYKDSDIERLVRHCNHRLKNIVKRFSEYGIEINPRRCAEIIMREEDERWPNPLEGCKFYKGAEDRGSSNYGMIGNYEMSWVSFKRDDNEYLLNNLAEFIAYGLMDMDNRSPKSFQAILWNRYCHWGYMSTPDDFERWYYEHYYGTDN